MTNDCVAARKTQHSHKCAPKGGMSLIHFSKQNAFLVLICSILLCAGCDEASSDKGDDKDNTQCDAKTGTCEPNDETKCTNNTWKCDENTLSKCIAGRWEILKTCDINTQCNAEKGSCEPNKSECKVTEHFFAGQCEADDVTHCGTHTNDCTKLSGWKNGNCIGKACFAEKCEIGYHLASLFDSDNKERTICEEDTHDACGSINTKCGTNEICTQGKCTDKCKPGEVNCGGSCINPMTSQDFCGADASCSSFIPCSEFEECRGGKCILSSCPNEDESLCIGTDQNVCVNIHGSNLSHCGACGAVCSDIENAKASGCSHGQCTYTCNDNMVNCGSDTEPLCLSKDQLKSDSLHCGKCDTKCAENAYCEDGLCIINACTGNECLYNNTCVNEDTHCGTQCLNCNMANLASVGICQDGTCIITSCVAGFHLTNEGTCEIDSDTACPNGNENGTVNCNTLEHTKTGICEKRICKATECQDNAHIKDNKCVADTIETCGSEENDCTKIPGWKTGKCENGKCVATTCQNGFCLNTLQGQCTNAQSSTTCGIDGNACQSCTIKQICSDGTCAAKQCTGNVCQQPTGADEEDLCQNDDTHCGSECLNCNAFTSYVTAGTCNITEGTCQVTACKSGYHIYNNACVANIYEGQYNLVTTMNAMKLLPRVDKGSDEVVIPFDNMLAGDWVDFALRFLNDPSAGLSEVLIQQFLPKLLDANFTKELLLNMGLNEAIAEEFPNILSTFGFLDILADLFVQISANLGDVGDTQSVSLIVKDYAEQLALSGFFDVMDTQLDTTGSLNNVVHKYDSTLVNVGSFDTSICTSEVGTTYGKTADGSGTICKIRTSSLALGSALQSNIKIAVDKPNKTASFLAHQMTIPYGRLIMNVLMKILPQMANIEDESHHTPETFAQVVEFFMGKGAAGYYNKSEDIKALESAGTDNPYIPEYISETGGCSTFGLVLNKSLKLPPAFTTIFWSAVCKKIIEMMDEDMNHSFDSLASYHNIVQFSSDSCELTYNSTETRLVSFGGVENESGWWGANPDKRCTWNIKVGGSDDCTVNAHDIESNCTEGKFFATRPNDGD